MRAALYERQGGLCFYCGYPLTNGGRGFVLDHLVPRSKGGGDGPTNRVAACRLCDSKKRDRMPTVEELEKQRRIT